MSTRLDILYIEKMQLACAYLNRQKPSSQSKLVKDSAAQPTVAYPSQQESLLQPNLVEESAAQPLNSTRSMDIQSLLRGVK